MGSKFASRVIDNVRDAREMGLRFPLRHFRFHREGTTVRVMLKGVGPIRLRRHTSDALVFSQIFSRHEYDLRSFPQFAGIAERYETILAGGRCPLIIDAGANNGASALWFAHQFPEAKIVAIEPEPSNAHLCKQNSEGFNIEVLPVAIGCQAGAVDLVTENRGKWAVMTTRRLGGATVVCTIPEIVSSYASQCDLFMVKIDIEGFESDLFATNTDWVADAKVIIIEPHDWMLPGQSSSRNFQRVLSMYDFEVLISRENLIYIQSSTRVQPGVPASLR